VQIRTRITNQLQAEAPNERLRCRKRLWREKRVSFLAPTDASGIGWSYWNRLNPTVAELTEAKRKRQGRKEREREREREREENQRESAAKL